MLDDGMDEIWDELLSEEKGDVVDFGFSVLSLGFESDLLFCRSVGVVSVRRVTAWLDSDSGSSLNNTSDRH